MFLASTLGVVAATVIAFLALTLILVALLLFTKQKLFLDGFMTITRSETLFENHDYI